MSVERRGARRIEVELHVEFRHLGRGSKAPMGDLSRDISAGGVFVSTSVALSVGTQVELEIAPGPGAPPIRMRAEVVRVEEEPGQTGSRSTGRLRGMGLRFIDSEPGELSRLLSLAKQIERDPSDEHDRPG